MGQTQEKSVNAIAVRYKQLVDLATDISVPLVFASPSAIADLAEKSPALQAALEHRWGVEKYNEFITKKVNIDTATVGDRPIDNSDLSLFLQATYRTEMLTFAKAKWFETGGLLVGDEDVDTAVALYTLFETDEVAQQDLRKAGIHRTDIERLKTIATCGVSLHYGEVGKYLKYTKTGSVDFSRSSPTAVAALYDVLYISDAQKVVEYAPSFFRKAKDKLVRHPQIRALAMGSPTLALLTAPLAPEIYALAQTDTTNVPAYTAQVVAALSTVIGVGCVALKKAHDASKTSEKEAKAAIGGTDGILAAAQNSRRVQLVRSKNWEKPSLGPSSPVSH